MREKNISEDRKKYLRKIKKEKLSIVLTQIFILIIFIIGWEILANKRIIDSFITSQPSRILNTFLNLSSNGLLHHLGVTLSETLIRIYLRCYFRSNYCHLLMVVSILIKGIRTLSGSTK